MPTARLDDIQESPAGQGGKGNLSDITENLGPPSGFMQKLGENIVGLGDIVNPLQWPHLARGMVGVLSGLASPVSVGPGGIVYHPNPVLEQARSQTTGANLADLVTAAGLSGALPLATRGTRAGFESLSPELQAQLAQIPAAAKGAARGAVKGATSTANRWGIQVPRPVAGAAIGGFAAHELGIPSEYGAVAGALSPIAHGAYSGAREALFGPEQVFTARGGGPPIGAYDISAPQQVFTGAGGGPPVRFPKQPPGPKGKLYTPPPVEFNRMPAPPGTAGAADPLLEDLAQSLEKKSFAKLTPDQQNVIRDFAARSAPRTQMPTAPTTVRIGPAQELPPAPGATSPPAAVSGEPTLEDVVPFKQHTKAWTDVTRQFHALGKQLDLPGSPEGAKLPLTPITQEIYGVPGEIAHYEQVVRINEFLRQHGRPPTMQDVMTGEFKP